MRALAAVAKKVDVLQTKQRLLEYLFCTLLHQLMTAQIRVNDLALPEEALTLTLSHRERELRAGRKVLFCTSAICCTHR
jgi:hypothetical protein